MVQSATTSKKENAGIIILLNRKHIHPKVVPSSVPMAILAPNYNLQGSPARYAGT